VQAEKLRQCIVSAVSTAAVTDHGLDIGRTTNGVQIVCDQGGALYASNTADCPLFMQLNYVALGLEKPVTSTTTTSTQTTRTSTTTRTHTTRTRTTATYTTGHLLASNSATAATPAIVVSVGLAFALAAALALR
jgi:hypothetical protein